ncbi:MAG: hypothetical protein AVDCRST_MAG47-3084 [uncultured Nocardioidaceae bacterium]|uniref:Thymidylate kinase n=1 Tax=uncultured Nocardioidaceae bacterium TaxID=253824 RepID=A0A6J4NZG6_9ACTN|nr:MAG: hypothetical protein AVDCRST_MAG47-3084 [uncultured Nocardioidaceae bacterium]
MTGTMERLARAWDDAGVRWALIRGQVTLARPGSDVDLLIHPADWAVAEETLRSEGGIAYPRWRYPGHREFQLQELRLDTVTELRYSRRDPVSSGLEDGCLERRVRDGWLWQLSPTDTFWTVLLHCVLDKGAFKERRRAELSATCPVLLRGSTPEAFTAQVLPADWSTDRVVACVQDELWDELEELAVRLRPPSPLARRAVARARDLTADGFVRAAGVAGSWSSEQTGRRVMRRQTRISFSGLDGAGKSYQIAALRQEFDGAGDISVVWLPFRIWPEPILNRLPEAIRSRLGPARPAVTSVGPGRPPAGPRSSAHRRLKALFWTPIACMSAISVGLNLRRRAGEPTTPVVVLDRYRLDSIVKLYYWYSEVSPRLLARIVQLVAPRPDVEVLLRVPAEEAYRRKAEQWTVGQLTRQAAAYDVAATHTGALVLDGCQPPDVVTKQLLEHVRAVMGEGKRA